MKEYIERAQVLQIFREWRKQYHPDLRDGGIFAAYIQAQTGVMPGSGARTCSWGQEDEGIGESLHRIFRKNGRGSVIKEADEARAATRHPPQTLMQGQEGDFPPLPESLLNYKIRAHAYLMRTF